MTQTVPTLSQWIALVQQDIEARFPGGGVYRAQGVLPSLARVKAGIAYAQGQHLLYVGKQVTPLYSDDDTLLKQAATYKMSPIPAFYAAGPITINGNVGAVIDSSAIFQADSGVQYQVNETLTLTGTTATVQVVALSDGIAGDLDAGAPLNLVSPVLGIQSAAVVAEGGIEGGAPQETIDQLRARLLRRIRQPPAGGNRADFIQWVTEAYANVAGIWIFEDTTTATVTVLFTVLASVGGPVAPDDVVATVDAYLQVHRPLTTKVVTATPDTVAQDFIIGLTPDTTPIRNNVKRALQALLDTEGAPGGTILISHLRTAIGTAAGVTNYTLNLTTDQTYAPGFLPVMGVITWT